MKDKQSLHLRVQQLVDCYGDSEPLREMSIIEKEKDKEEAALKWLALATLHGIDAGAEEISVQKGPDGKVRVVAEYRDAELPSPGTTIGEKIIETLRGITHLEGDKEKLPLALGLRDSSIELTVKVKKDKNGETVTLKFPK
ncbi:MAG: hypothetical protein EHM26_02220 [Desulfobacteraceae bacterium]|nr:MAG: hypothetical protein EHM26_02220 [Desulfobacteraceae bacterium]